MSGLSGISTPSSRIRVVAGIFNSRVALWSIHMTAIIVAIRPMVLWLKVVKFDFSNAY